MKKGIFSRKISFLENMYVSILTIIGLIITIINPISWLVYLISYKIFKLSGHERNRIKLVSQWMAFISSIIVIIVIIKGE